MAVIRRILKYTPAYMSVLLIVIWAMGSVLAVRVVLPVSNRFHGAVGLERGSLYVLTHQSGSSWALIWDYYPPYLVKSSMLGHAQARVSEARFALMLPIPFLLALLFPLVLGPFLSFRFRLWHYLAYMALVALELAYYLRWQE